MAAVNPDSVPCQRVFALIAVAALASCATPVTPQGSPSTDPAPSSPQTAPLAGDGGQGGSDRRKKGLKEFLTETPVTLVKLPFKVFSGGGVTPW